MKTNHTSSSKELMFYNKPSLVKATGKECPIFKKRIYLIIIIRKATNANPHIFSEIEEVIPGKDAPKKIHDMQWSKSR